YVSADPQSPAPGAEETLRFARAVEATGLSTADDDDWSDIFSKLMTEYVEPTLGHGRPTLLTHYPACEAALAQLDEKDPRFAERVELYVCGVEVANGFAELTDADALQRRFENQMDEMERRYSRRYPIDADFITAVSSMPAANGCALGFDRLVMLATAAPSVHDVIWTPAAPIT
ncbi:MAG: amino acid--tRNA ligase-related protein, partial [Pseudomonadota bacterium]